METVIKHRICLVFLVLAMTVTLMNEVQAQGSRPFHPEWSGYVKELGQLAFTNDLGGFRYDNILHHRLESEWTLSESLELRADIRTRLLNGYTVMNSPGLKQFYERDPNYFDLAWVWLDTPHALLHSNIDRLHLSYFSGSWEIHAGRQRINWGRTFVWNPNDLFNNFAFLDFDYEERPGVDALLAHYSWSYASGVELGIRPGHSWNESVIAGMIRASLGDYDIQFTAGHYLQNVTAGFGWAGYLKDAGFKGEVSYFHPERDFWNSKGHVTATFGFDYMLNNGTYLQSEFLYNGGFDRTGSPLNQLFRPPRADDLFIARSGYLLNASHQFHPLVSGTMSLLGSFDRSIFIMVPQLAVSVYENLDLLVLSQLLKGSVFGDAIETPNFLFVRLKYSY